MKALIVITGRGMGGDAVNALNITKALEKIGFQCEIALDTNAPGLLFKKMVIPGIKFLFLKQGVMQPRN